MTMRRPGLLAGAWHVARRELAELRSSPGLYLFIPLLLLQTLGPRSSQSVPSTRRLLVTPGRVRRRADGVARRPASACSCCSTRSSRSSASGSTRLAAIVLATPIRTGSVLLGKADRARRWSRWRSSRPSALGGVIAILIQGEVRLDLRPFLVYWGLLLVPTVLLWIAFVMAVHSLTQNRYTTYAVALGVLIFTGYRLLTDQINWVGNWPMWRPSDASDMSVLELDRRALVLSRSRRSAWPSSSPSSRSVSTAAASRTPRGSCIG